MAGRAEQGSADRGVRMDLERKTTRNVVMMPAMVHGGLWFNSQILIGRGNAGVCEWHGSIDEGRRQGSTAPGSSATEGARLCS